MAKKLCAKTEGAWGTTLPLYIDARCPGEKPGFYKPDVANKTNQAESFIFFAR
jgi:hypothetical protein